MAGQRDRQGACDQGVDVTFTADSSTGQSNRVLVGGLGVRLPLGGPINERCVLRAAEGQGFPSFPLALATAGRPGQRSPFNGRCGVDSDTRGNRQIGIGQMDPQAPRKVRHCGKGYGPDHSQCNSGQRSPFNDCGGVERIGGTRSRDTHSCCAESNPSTTSNRTASVPIRSAYGCGEKVAGLASGPQSPSLPTTTARVAPEKSVYPDPACRGFFRRVNGVIQ